jgi:hypothetical protein
MQRRAGFDNSLLKNYDTCRDLELTTLKSPVMGCGARLDPDPRGPSSGKD